MVPRIRTVALGLCALALLGCRKPEQPPTTTPAQPAPEATPPTPSIEACPAPDPFATLRWVPQRSEAVTLVALNDPALPEALALLQQGARETDRQLPIRVAFALGQWTWQVPLLRTTLARAGFDPAQLVHIALPDGTSAWAWPPSCDLTTLGANLERGWSLSLRATPYGAVAPATTNAEGELVFPYDFVAYGASAYLLVPAGRAQAVAQQLAIRPDAGATSLGEVAAGLDAAPLRLVVRNTALLTPGSTAPTPISAHRIDGRTWSSPG